MASTDRAPSPATAPSGPPRVRLDKWLWAARFYKSRGLATEAIDAGHVKIDGERVKPSRGVKVGDRLTIWRGGRAWELDITGLAERRGSATVAAQLYAETAESVAAREAELARRREANARFESGGRPTKRSRRRLEDFLAEP